MKLNIGAGESRLDGFTPVDIKTGTDAAKLPYGDNSADVIYASHVLEHFDWNQIPSVLKEWFRVLRPNGRIMISVPDFEKIARGYLEGRREQFARYLMGGQVDQHDYHKSVFDRETLTDVLQAAGFVDISEWKSENPDTSQHWISLNLGGRKPSESPAEKPPDYTPPKVFAVLSAPRLGFLDTWACIAQSLTVLKIPLLRVTGAFWSQCLTRGIEDAIKSGAEFVLTLDYDSIFGPDDIRSLIALAEKYPDADAIAPIQARRDADCSLFVVYDNNGNLRKTMTYAELGGDLCPVSTAHFGLTLLRASKFAALSKPWFQETPDSSGGWGDGRIDADIAFWQNWKTAGNTLYIAPRITIGHIQTVVSWPNTEMRPIHQYVADFFKTGKPKETWQ